MVDSQSEEYEFRSRNTGKISRTRLGASLQEYADYFSSEAFDIPGSVYVMLVLFAPVVVGYTYMKSFDRDGPIEKARKVQL